MRTLRGRLLWTALALVVLIGAMAAPSLGKALWQGLKIETTITIDVKQAKSAVPLDLEPSAFAFEPVAVKVTDDPKKATKVITLQIKLKNNSDKDYYVYGNAVLLDADGKPIATDSDKDKADDHDSARMHMRFKLTYAEVERIKSCKLGFAFEKE